MHSCRGTYKSGDNGPAIEECDEREDGSFWVGNSEYGSQVNYCPFCGAKAPTPAERPDWYDELDVPVDHTAANKGYMSGAV